MLIERTTVWNQDLILAMSPELPVRDGSLNSREASQLLGSNGEMEMRKPFALNLEQCSNWQTHPAHMTLTTQPLSWLEFLYTLWTNRACLSSVHSVLRILNTGEGLCSWEALVQHCPCTREEILTLVCLSLWKSLGLKPFAQ